MGSEKNLQAVFQVLGEFYTFVGLSINYDKTTIVRIGSLHHSKAIFYTQNKLAWSDGVFTLLGGKINIHDLHDISCYQSVSKKMYTVLDSWVHRHLTVYGKVAVLNFLYFSRIYYHLMVHCNPNLEFYQEIKHKVLEFLWDNKHVLK